MLEGTSIRLFISSSVHRSSSLAWRALSLSRTSSPVNMGIIFLIGAVLGWVSVKAFRPGEHLQGLVIACCSSGNWGTIPLMIVPAICNEEGSPFGDANTCNLLGLSYVSLSMALGNFYIWTHSYSVMKRSAKMYKAKCKNHAQTDTSKEHFGQDATGDYMAFLPPDF
ncbi:hypothetical protein SEVIR_9G559201v4 [Setaria viridis]